MPERGQDMRPDPESYDSKEIEDKVAQNLVAISDDDSPTPSEPEEPEASDEPKPEEQEPEASDEPKPGDDDKPEAEPKDADEDLAIPDDLFRSAKFQGWEPEEIVGFWKSNPELAKKTLEKLHKSTIDISQQFSDIGRKSRDLPQPAVQPQKVEEVEDFVDMKKLRDQYEDNPLVDVIETLNKGLKKVVTEQQQVATQPVPSGASEEDALARQAVSSFFTADDMKPFNDFYGTSKSIAGEDLSPGCRANRQAVINEAVDIMTGAELMRKEMSIEQAMERAHLKIASPFLPQVVRSGIMAEARTRSKGLTLKPNSSKTPAPATGPGGKPTETQLEVNTRERLKKLGILAN